MIILSHPHPYGVIVEQGPIPWTILQQINGHAVMTLSGYWTAETAEEARAQVYARVVNENDSAMVVPWHSAEMNEARRWSVQLTLPAGGLYRVETCLSIGHEAALEWAIRGDMIHHLGVGDLYVIAGQSNAAGYGRGPFYDPPEPGVHLLRNSGLWDIASHPFNESTATIHPENREGANPGHSPFLAFGRIIRQRTGWPIGLIQTALGGSPLKSWNPAEDGALYNNMLRIVQSAGGRIRGVLWYQGCSDANPGDAATYLDRFRNVVDSWRQDLNDPELPVLTVQLNRYTAVTAADEAANRAWGTVREAQRQAAETIPGVHVIPALDCPLSDEIHNSPAGNMMIGERMANAALANIYGLPALHQAPRLAEAAFGPPTANGQATVRLRFADVAGRLSAIGPHEQVFTVEDNQGSIGIDRWSVISCDRIELVLSRPPEGAARVHGAYETNPAAYLPLDIETHMPMLAFYGAPIED